MRFKLCLTVVMMMPVGGCKTPQGSSVVKDDAVAANSLDDVLSRIDGDLDAIGVAQAGAPAARDGLALADAPGLPAQVEALVTQLNFQLASGAAANAQQVRSLVLNLQALSQLMGPSMTAEQGGRVTAIIQRAAMFLHASPPPSTPSQPTDPLLRCFATCEPPFAACKAGHDHTDQGGCFLDWSICRTNCFLKR